MVDLEIEGLCRFRVIGSGGFATVYAAWDESFRRWVAVKVLPALDDDGRRRFDRERALMGQLDAHPNVVTPYRSGYTPAGDGFLVMEHVGGDSLQTLLDRRGSLRLEESIGHLLPITGALETGHRLGILHLDIKPANILLTTDGVPKLADFGISATRDATTTAAAFTLAQAPPESFADGYDRQDERSDLYSLVSTLYTLVRGREPFAVEGHDSVRAHLMRILTHAPPSTGWPDLDEFFAIGLAKDPEDRFQSAADLAGALEAFSAGTWSPSAASPPEPPVDSSDTRQQWLVPPSPAPLDTPSSKALPLFAASVAVIVAGLAMFVFNAANGDTPSAPMPGDLAAEPVPTTVGPTLDFEDLPPTTGPGPGSFSVGQLKLGLLTAEDLPVDWTVGPDGTVVAFGMELPCGAFADWPEDASSPQVMGSYSAASGSVAVEHSVWVMDDWISVGLFDEFAAASANCRGTWTEPAADGDIELAIASSPRIASLGDDTLISTTISTTVDAEAGSEAADSQTVTVLSRCGGLVSSLVLSSPAAESSAEELVNDLAASAYDRLTGVAEWENATCPPR